VSGKTRNAPGQGLGSFQRVGEGALVDLTVQAVRDVEGAGLATYSANLGSAPVPHRRYSADRWSLVYSRETVKLLFGQERISTNELRTLLIIKMSPGAAKHFLSTVDAVVGVGFAGSAEMLGISAEEAVNIESEPTDTVAFDANFIVAASVGRESCMDFYHASAFSKGAVLQTHKLALDPIVRVDLRSSMVLGLIDSLRVLIARLPDELLKG
jgi:hypothetical protein